MDIDLLEESVNKIFGEMQDDLIRRMSRRISKMGFVSETTKYEAERAIAAGAVYEDIVKAVAETSEKSEAEIRRYFDEADWDEYLQRYAPGTVVKVGSMVISGGIYQIICANRDKLNRHILNLTGTTAVRTQESFIKACDKAYSEVISGAVTRDSAVTEAIRDMAREGVTVQYPSGHVDTVDVAAKRAVRTAAAQTAGKITENWIKEHNHDLVETSAHAGARLRHIPWQGKRFSYSGEDKRYPDFVTETEYGNPLGLLGYNCRHLFFPAYDFTEPVYSDEQLREMAEKEVTYNGERIKLYEATGKQRAMERKIRKTKRELIGLDELKRAGNKDAAREFDKQSLRLRKQREKLSDFLNQTGLKKAGGNEQVIGFDRSVSMKAVHGAKRELTKELERGIIKEIKQIRGFNTGEIHLIPAKIDTTRLGFNEKHVNGEHDRNISKEEAIGFINNARISITKRNGLTENYFSDEGAVYVNPTENEIKTAYKKEQFDDNIKNLMEVLNKYGI